MLAYQLLSASAEEITVNDREALSYLGYRQAADPSVSRLLEDAKKLLVPALSYRAVCIELPLTVEERRVTVGSLVFDSADLANRLRGCAACCLFAATLGVAVDRVIAAASHRSAACAAMVDALGSAAIEAWCDRVEATLTAGQHSRARYSPGYGDWQLSAQRSLLQLLDTARRIGLSMTDALMLTPTKSVTALIGIDF